MMKRLMPNQQSLAEAATRVAKRQWHWCRRPNGFSDKPEWRVVAAKADVPLTQVLSLVNKLEETANAAGNVGHSRGYVGDFSAATFGAALDIPPENADRIFSALADVGWVSLDHIADFYDRNKDAEDVGQAGRQRRSRAFRRALRDLVAQFRAGAFDDMQRDARERELYVLKARHSELEESDLLRAIHRIVFGEGVVHMSHLSQRDMSRSQRDTVTVTTEKITSIKAPTVDNSGTDARGEAEKATDKEVESPANLSTCHGVTAEQWITTDGVMLVIERLQVVRTRAETLIERWLRDLNDAEVLKTVIEDAAIQTVRPSQFLVIVTDQLRRHIETRAQGQRLPLGPTIVNTGIRKVGHG